MLFFLGNEVSVPWSRVELAAIVFMEFTRSGQVQLDEIASWPLYETHFNEQMKKLQELGVDVSIDGAPTAATSADNKEDVGNEVETQLEDVETRKYAIGEKMIK